MQSVENFPNRNVSIFDDSSLKLDYNPHSWLVINLPWEHWCPSLALQLRVPQKPKVKEIIRKDYLD